MWKTFKHILLDLFFPKFCLNCGKENDYLCEDCRALIDVAEYQFCPFCSPPKIVLDSKTCKYCTQRKKLNGLFSAASYQEPLLKKMVRLFKYQPFIKELAKPLALLIIVHFQISGKKPKADFCVPIPLHKKKLKERGFNQATKIALELSNFLAIPVLDDVLLKQKQTPAQIELSKEEREKNIKGVFLCQRPELVKGKRILLVDDIFTTGATMEECACVLKKAGAYSVWGAVAARE